MKKTLYKDFLVNMEKNYVEMTVYIKNEYIPMFKSNEGDEKFINEYANDRVSSFVLFNERLFIDFYFNDYTENGIVKFQADITYLGREGYRTEEYYELSELFKEINKISLQEKLKKVFVNKNN